MREFEALYRLRKVTDMEESPSAERILCQMDDFNEKRR